MTRIEQGKYMCPHPILKALVLLPPLFLWKQESHTLTYEQVLCEG